MKSRNTGLRLARFDRRLMGAAALAVSMLAGGSVASAAPIFSSSTPGYTSVTLAAGTYDIVATGAGGGGDQNRGNATGGVGAVVEGTFTFASSETLSLLIGGVGALGNDGGGGGGGTFVVGPGTTALLVAGGGGGSGGGLGGNGGAIASTGGGGGIGANLQGGGGGGGGLTGNGSNAANNAGKGGFSFTNGGAGGAGDSIYGGQGGVGGGGGGGAFDGGGGGGGYSGGDGGNSVGRGNGGLGGTSFNAGLNSLFSLAASVGNGSVVITDITSPPPVASISEPASLAVLGMSVAGLLGWRRRGNA